MEGERGAFVNNVTSLTKDEIIEATLYFPLILMLWLPTTILLFIALYYHIRWQYFGLTEGINYFYISKFKTSYDLYIYIAKQAGLVGIIAFCLSVIGYLWMTRKIIIAFLNENNYS